MKKPHLMLMTILVVLLLPICANATGIAEIYKNKAVFDGKETITLCGEPFMYKGESEELYVPVDDILPSLNAVLGWDSSRNAEICIFGGKTYYIYPHRNEIEYNGEYLWQGYKPMIRNGVFYISASTVKTITGAELVAKDTLPVVKGRDTLSDSQRVDSYRLSGNNVVRGGGVTVVDGFGMELVSANAEAARNYAGVINAVAQSIPDVNVYNIVVPTAAEFYAPLSMYPSQLSGIKTVYENLADNVTPVNVYDTLAAHAGEKIYFSTDHHWTQRGAYYAYKAFIELKGKSIDSLDSFTNVPSYNFVGSFAGFASGTYAGSIMKSSPELLERFVPKYATVGTVFSDCATQRVQYVVNAVNTGYNSYSCFVGGDGPVTVFYTDAPSDESIVIIKESFGNAFATWAMHNYKKVCIVDPRKFNGFGGNYNTFNLKTFCDRMEIDDAVFINYPVAVSSSGIRGAILNMK